MPVSDSKHYQTYKTSKHQIIIHFIINANDHLNHRQKNYFMRCAVKLD